MNTTVIDNSNGVIKHTYKNGFEVVADFKNERISVSKNDAELQCVDFSKTPYSLADYDKLLHAVDTLSDY